MTLSARGRGAHSIGCGVSGSKPDVIVTAGTLNRGDDWAANSALHIIAIGRLRTDPRTKAYIAKRVAEGHSKLEAVRCLKRYNAREVFSLIGQRKGEINQSRNAA